MTTARTLRRQPIIELDMQMQLLEFQGRAREVADILPRKLPQGAARVAALMDKLFPPSGDETKGPAWARPRGDVVRNLVSHLGFLIDRRWHLLSADRRARLFSYGGRWWRRPTALDEHDAAARAIWDRVRFGRADMDDARDIVEAAVAILAICNEVVAMHYEAASHTPLSALSTWKPWKAPKPLRRLTASHAG